jgi:hypothetical protein
VTVSRNAEYPIASSDVCAPTRHVCSCCDFECDCEFGPSRRLLFCDSNSTTDTWNSAERAEKPSLRGRQRPLLSTIDQRETELWSGFAMYDSFSNSMTSCECECSFASVRLSLLWCGVLCPCWCEARCEAAACDDDGLLGCALSMLCDSHRSNDQSLSHRRESSCISHGKRLAFAFSFSAAALPAVDVPGPVAALS